MEVTIVIPGVITVSFLSLFYCCMMPEVGRKDRLEAFEKQYIAHRGFHDNASFSPRIQCLPLRRRWRKNMGLNSTSSLQKTRFLSCSP